MDTTTTTNREKGLLKNWKIGSLQKAEIVRLDKANRNKQTSKQANHPLLQFYTQFLTSLVLLLGLGLSSLTAQTISFGSSPLTNITLTNPTSLQFGPDDRLYVAQQNGEIHIFTIQRNAANDYTATADETVFLIKQIPNHNDDGSLYTTDTSRQVTGLLVVGTAANPVVYVASSDPRIGAGPSGVDTNLDTNSGMISRLDWDGSQWTRTDLVRGLPRSEENHSCNGMQLDEATNTLYVAQGGHTNMGALSNNFAFVPEYAYSAAILAIDLTAIGNTTYDLPTLDDEDKANTSTVFGFEDFSDPFGGNDGKNQAILEPTGPVQIYSSGWRNAYDVLITQSGRMYTFDNGPNAGWGDVPTSCDYTVEEPGTTEQDNLHLITGQGYYGGHPNLTRGNRNNTFNLTNPQTPIPPSMENPVECNYLFPLTEDGALVLLPASSNGLAEYTASNFGGAMQGDLIVAALNNKIYRIELNATGDIVLSATELFTGFGGNPLDVIAQGNNDPFPGTIWSANIFGNDLITVFEPADYDGAGFMCDPMMLDPLLDDDVDGYSNDDEEANGTDPCSAASRPDDNDGDFVSDLLDPDDDNDGTDDIFDVFAVDPQNGTTTFLPIIYSWDNGAAPAGGLGNLGFTGLMSNDTDNYKDLFDPANMTAGGAAGVTTIDAIPPGDAFENLNDQEYGFQFGVNAAAEAFPFMVHTRVQAPFAGITPTGNQSMGLFVGTGKQDDFLKMVIAANGGAGSIEVFLENGDVAAPAPDSDSYAAAVLTASFVDLFLIVDAVNHTVQPAYSINGGTRINVGSIRNIPATWTSNPLAVGIISTSRNATPFPVTWDFFEVRQDPLSSTGQWNEVLCNGHPTCTSEPTNRHENSFTQVGDKFYLLGGRGNRAVEIYDPMTNEWTTGATPPIELHHFQAIEYEGLLYVMGAFTGGFPSETPVPNIYIYDPISDEWKVGPAIPAARQRGSAGCVVHNEKIYVVCGIQNGHQSGWVPWLDEYDPLTNTWTVLPDAPHARDHYHAAITNGKIYSIGGRQSGGSGTFAPLVPETDIYDISAGTWQTLPSITGDLPTPRAGCTAAVLGNEVLIIGGESLAQFTAHNETEGLDVLTNTWRSLAPLNTGRHGTQAIVNNGGIYIAAGSGNRGGSPELNSMESYYLFGQTTPTGTAISKGALGIPFFDINFGTVELGNSVTETLILSNTGGNQALLINDIALTGNADLSLGFPYATPFILRAGDVVAIDVTYTPSALDGGITGTLQIDHCGSNGPNSTVTISGGAQGAAIRINCGGNDHITDEGLSFIADANFTGSSGTFVSLNPIHGTTEDELYQSERYGWSNFLKYAVPVAVVDSYTVKLHFAEVYWNEPGKRVFDVFLEGNEVLTNYDIFAVAGKDTAVVEEFDIFVTDGLLNIDFNTDVNAAKINAIEVIGKTDTIPPVNQPPTFSVSGDITVLENFATTETVIVTPDPPFPGEESQVANYTISPPTISFANVMFDSNTGNVTITAIPNQFGTQVFTITADDGQPVNNTATQDFTLTVNPLNFAPTFDVSGDITVEQDFVGTQIVTVFPDPVPPAETGQTVTYSLSPPTVSFANVSIDPMTGTVNITAITNKIGSQLFTIIADDGQVSNNIATNVFTLSVNPSFGPGQSIRINCGGNEHTTAEGLQFIQDFFVVGTSSNTFTKYNPINGTTDDILYQTERYGFGPNLQYAIPIMLPDTFTVRLHFAEVFWTTNNARKFDVQIEGNLVLDDYDIHANAGANTAIVETIEDVIVNDGMLNLNFQSVVNAAKLSAIEIFAQDDTTTIGNTPPTFSLSGDITVAENFATTETVIVTPDPVPPGEAGQTVTYTLTPPSVTFANVSFDPMTGNVSITSIPDEFGTQVFTISADDGQPFNNLAFQPFTLTVNPVGGGNSAIRINCGGADHITVTDSLLFIADTFYTSSNGTYTSFNTIAGTPDQALYKTERYGYTNQLRYAIPVESGSYTVRLHFAELYWTLPNKRVFDIKIEGTLVENNYDIYADVGNLTAVVKEYTGNLVVDGILHIDFEASLNAGKLSAIEVIGEGSENKQPSAHQFVKHLGAPSLQSKDTTFSSDKNGQFTDTAVSAHPNLHLYPNPTAGIFVLKMVNISAGDYFVEVYDMLGRQWHQERIFSKNAVLEQEVDLRDAPNGVYLVKVRGVGLQVVEKVFKTE